MGPDSNENCTCRDMDNGHKRSKKAKIAAVGDKCMITAVFANSLSGISLPNQLVYKGTTQKCLPKTVLFLKIGT